MRTWRSGLAALGVALSVTLGALPGAGADTSESEAATTNAALSVGLVADAQYCDCPPKRTRYYRASLTKLSRAVGTFNATAVDFTVQVGDLIDRYPESFDAILPIYARLNAPGRHVLGNHDFPLASAEVVQLLGMPNAYYQFSRPGWRFLVLDTNDISLYANPQGSADHNSAQDVLAKLKAAYAPNAKAYNGAAGGTQRVWLRRALARAESQDRRVIVFGHMPIHHTGQHNAWDDAAIRGTLESSGNVVAYVSGHNHAGSYALQNGIHHVNLRGMLEKSPTSNAYAVMHIFGDRLRIDGFGREPDRRLPLNS